VAAVPPSAGVHGGRVGWTCIPVGPAAGPGASEVGGGVADGSPTPGVCRPTVASAEGGVFPGGVSVAPGVAVAGIAVASGLAGGGAAVDPGWVGMGDGLGVASAGVADEAGSGVGVRNIGGSPVTLVGGGMVGVAEGVTGRGVGVKVGIV